MDAESVVRKGLLRVAPREQGDVAARSLEELPGDLLREALVAVANGAAADARDRRYERQRDEDEPDHADRDADPRPVAGADLSTRPRPPQPVSARRRAVEQAPPPGVGAVERGGREQRRERQPGELDLPALRSQRALAVGREGDRDHRPGERRARHQQDRGRERKAREEPADAGEAHQP